MPVVNLERPGLVGAAVLTGTDIGTAGTKFFIKVHDSRFRGGSPGEDTTGDGDTYPTFENNGMFYGLVRLVGLMVASQAAGLNNIINTSNNPVSYRQNMGATRTVGGTLLVEWMDFDFKRQGAYVPVVVTGKLTATDPSTVEGAVS